MLFAVLVWRRPRAGGGVAAVRCVSAASYDRSKAPPAQVDSCQVGRAENRGHSVVRHHDCLLKRTLSGSCGQLLCLVVSLRSHRPVPGSSRPVCTGIRARQHPPSSPNVGPAAVSPEQRHTQATMLKRHGVLCRRRLRRLCRGRHVDISAFSRYRCQQVSRGLLFFGWVFARGRFSWVEALAEHAEPLRLKVKRWWTAGESNPLTSATQTASTLLRLETAGVAECRPERGSRGAVVSARAGEDCGVTFRLFAARLRADAGFAPAPRASQPPACLI